MSRKQRRQQERERRREVQRQHRWRPGQYPGDPDAGNPKVEYRNLGRMIEEDAARAPKPALWTPGSGPESGMPCPNCGGPTYIIDSKTASEILEPFVQGGQMMREVTEKILALACPQCDRPVMQMRASALPRRS